MADVPKVDGQVEFCSTDFAFGMLKCLFRSKEGASAAATATMENDKWVFFLIYMGKRTFNMKVRAIPLMVKVDRIQAAVFKEVNDYKLVRMEVTETISNWGYGVEIGTQTNNNNLIYIIKQILVKTLVHIFCKSIIRDVTCDFGEKT